MIISRVNFLIPILVNELIYLLGIFVYGAKICTFRNISALPSVLTILPAEGVGIILPDLKN